MIIVDIFLLSFNYHEKLLIYKLSNAKTPLGNPKEMLPKICNNVQENRTWFEKIQLIATYEINIVDKGLLSAHLNVIVRKQLRTKNNTINLILGR